LVGVAVCEKNQFVKRSFAASLWGEGDWCSAWNVASPGKTEEEALAPQTGVGTALRTATRNACNRLRTIEVEVGGLRPLPFREVKQRHKAAGFIETT